MSLNLRVTSKKYYNSFYNGTVFNLNTSIFDTNLASLVLETCKVDFIVEVNWESISNSNYTFNIISRGGTEYEISRDLGNFIEDGWSVGNKFDYFDNYSTTETLVDKGEILFISDDGSYMFVDIATDISGIADDNALRANVTDVENQLQSIIYKPNLIENNDVYSSTYLQNGVEIGYQSDNIRSSTPVNMSVRGINKSFKTGDVSINYEGDVGNYYQSYKITHIFTVNPFYFEGDDFNTPPTFLNSNSSLKYVFECDFRMDLSNVDSTKKIIFQNNKGTVGYFNEDINKSEPIYNIKSLDYDGLNINKPTTITLTIETNEVIDSNTKFEFIYCNLATANIYLNSNNDFYDIFNFNSQSNFLNISSGYTNQLITNLSSTINNDGDIEISITFDKLSNFNDFNDLDEYLLALIIGNTNQHRKRCLLYIDKSNYISDTENNNLVTMTSSYENYDLLSDISTAGNESGLAINYSFTLDLNKQAIIKSLNASLVAHNPTTDDYFKLDNFTYSLPNLAIDGIQILDIDRSRGYLLPNTLKFNKVSINTGLNNNGFQTYDCVLGQKISWQSWIRNNNVSDIFYDNSKPNDNKNLKTSNYSLKEGYEVKMLFKYIVKGLDIYNNITDQEYLFFQEPIEILDYDDDGKEEQKIDGFIDIIVDNKVTDYIVNGEKNIFKSTFNLEKSLNTLTGVSVTHRIEVFEQNGYNIHELNSDIYLRTVNNPLLNSTNNNFVKLTLENPNKIIAECEIDTELLLSDNYSLSSEITKI